MSVSRLLPFNLTTSQKVIIVSVTAGVAVLGAIASYLGRRRTPRPQQRRLRKPGGRMTRNSVRSPNDIISLAGSKASGRSYSPGGSIHGVSDRMSLASGSLAGGGAGANAGSIIGATTPLTPQQLGVMGMEALETVISYWEDALTDRNNADFPSRITADQEEFCRELQNLLDAAYNLQEQGELLFLDERSVLFRDDENKAAKAGGSLSNGHRSSSDPNFDSAESFASALDQVADLREFEDYGEVFSDVENYPLYQSALELLDDQPIPCRTIRTDMVGCNSDAEYYAKLHCIRLAFQLLFKDPKNCRWVADTGRQVLTDLLCLGDKDPKDFLVAYESMLEFLQNSDNWQDIELELESRNVKAMTFYDIVLDFIILDAFRDLDSPPNSVLAVIQNRFLSNSFKETALTTAVWSVLKAKKRMLKFPNGFMSHFYSVTEQLSPLMVWGFFGPDENLKEVCKYFKDQMVSFMVDTYNFQKCRYTTVEELAEDILSMMKVRVNNIGVKFNQ